mmetsp:Transcript_10981/g.16154  ORF Transcript_10981/g.16154 Transcript_10981/m.16154 type:complete len:581 (+) Transcript_10981:29-1771(+)
MEDHQGERRRGRPTENSEQKTKEINDLQKEKSLYNYEKQQIKEVRGDTKTFFSSLLGLLFCGVLFKKYDRSVKYKMVLETLPNWALVIFIGFVNVVLLCAILGGVFAPVGVSRSTPKFTKLTPTIINGTSHIFHEISGLRPENLQIAFRLRLPLNESVDITKNDMAFKVILSGRNEGGNAWNVLGSEHNVHVKPLHCYQKTNWMLNWTEPELGKTVGSFQYAYLTNKCSDLHVVQESMLSYQEYRVEMTFQNLESIDHWLGGDIMTYFEFANQNFTIFEFIFRYVFVFLSLALALNFIGTMLATQQFKNWNTQQCFTGPLLILLMFYNNPFAIFDLVTPHFVFPIIHILFSFVFICSFLYYLLVFFHSLFVPQKKRKTITFYLFKFLIVLALFTLACTFFIWSRILHIVDPAAGVRDIPVLYYLEIVFYCIVFLYLVCLFYYIVKAIANARKLRYKYSSRYKVMGLLSIFVIVALTGVNIIINGFRYDAPGVMFLVSHSVIMLFFFACSIFFLPSSTVRKATEEDLVVDNGVDDQLSNEDEELNEYGIDEDNVNINEEEEEEEHGEVEDDVDTPMEAVEF